MSKEEKAEYITFRSIIAESDQDDVQGFGTFLYDFIDSQ
jgi:hypothetical protein